MNPFEPSDATPPTHDPHVLVAIIALLAIGVPLVVLGILMVPVGLLVGMTDPEFQAMGEAGPWAGLGIGLLEFVFVSGFGSVYLAGGAGLLMRKKWGWVLALVAFGMWMGGCCMPFGIYGFWALLREPVRKAYGF